MPDALKRAVLLTATIITALLLTPATAAAQCTDGLANTVLGASGLEGCGGILPAVGSVAAVAIALGAIAVHAVVSYVVGAAGMGAPGTTPPSLAPSVDAAGQAAAPTHTDTGEVATGAVVTGSVEKPHRTLEPLVMGGRRGASGWPKEYRKTDLDRMRLALMANHADIDRVTRAINDFGVTLDRDTVERIKRYNFDSPGLVFARDNYEAWGRLASGWGRVDDARYLVHEAAEIAELARAGVDYLGEKYADMTRQKRNKWNQQFYSTWPDGRARGWYVQAHGTAQVAEFKFVADLVRQATNGQMEITLEEAAAVDISVYGQQAREQMLIDGCVLQDHPYFSRWRARVKQIVPLDAATRTRLGDNLYQGTLLVNSYRAEQVRDGADPTLEELIAILKHSPMKWRRI